MSKAFTKESDDVPESPVRRRGIPVPELNFVTPAGLAAARAELERGGDPDRMRELAEHLATAHAVEPPADRTEVAVRGTSTRSSARSRASRSAGGLGGSLRSRRRCGEVAWGMP